MDQMDFVSIGYRVGMAYIPFLFALCFHEFSHGFVAKMLGDRTAEREGRLTLSPFAHADIMGTVILPIASIIFAIPLFGWAKPVPVDPRNMKDPKNGMFWVALAGPASNVLLAIVSTFILAVLAVYLGQRGPGEALTRMLQIFIIVNLMLALFNMLPLHPLDGGKVAERFLPYNANRWLEENQGTTTWVLILLVMMGGFKYLAAPVYWMADNLLNLAAIFASHLA